MNNLQIFKNKEFGEIRIIEAENEPWFIGKEIAQILGYKDTSDALKRHVDDEDKLTRCFSDSGQRREMYVINESGLYSLILSSKLPKAKKFKRWVTSEVLPSIRKHGMYAKDELLDNPDLLLDVIKKYKQEREEKLFLQKQAELNKPKVLFAEAWEVSEKSILVGEMAKLLARNGLENMGQNRFFKWLRDNGYLHKNGEQYNLPTQRSIELEIIEVKTTTITNTDGSVRVTKTPKITVKGQMYFLNKFKEKEIA